MLLGLCLLLLFPAGAILADRRWREISTWMREDRVPTPEERDATIGFPFRLVRKEAALWAIAAVPFVVLNALWSVSLGIQAGVEIFLGALTTCALVGSTSLAATWEPHRVVAELNAFFAIVVDCVTLHGGWVNKFEGDAALCVFGAPSAHPDAADAALATARALRVRLDRDLPDIRAAIGVSAGTVVAGNVGTPERYEYTVIGDPVNEDRAGRGY